ncbi:MAG: acyl-CoA dehydratase activase-related protein, partial [Polyangiales bacterium]
SAETRQRRESWQVAMPRVLNMYSTGPFWRAYFEALGVDRRHIRFSDPTSEEMWQEGGKYGSVDPCFPAKVVQAHIHNLLFHHHEKKPIDALFFPILTHVPSFLTHYMDVASCPIVAGTPDVIKAAFTKEQDFFAQRSIRYLAPALSFHEPNLLKERLFGCFERELWLTRDESDFAVDEGFKALQAFDLDLQDKGRAILETVAAEDRIAILLIGRPYHLDPGLNHGVPEEFQALGYPILSIRSIPKDPAWLAPYFQDDIDAGRIEGPLDINDVWPENYSANSAMKVWAAKFAARHPNVVLLDLSSFKCGHDAPTYGIIDRIVEASSLPYSALHDIDANKPGGSIKIRVKTYDHFLKLQRERLEDLRQKQEVLAQRIATKRLELLRMKAKTLSARKQHDAELQREIEALRVQVQQYAPSEAAASKAERDSSGLVQIGVKKAKPAERLSA